MASVSALASTEIKELLDDSQERINNLIKNTTERILTGKKVSDKALELFIEISKKIDVVNNQLKSIYEAGKQQVNKIEETTHSVRLIDEGMNDNQKIAQSNSILGERLKLISTKIQGLNLSLKEIIGGKSSKSSKTNKHI